MLNPRSRATALLLTALVAFGPVSTDMYLPALPGLTRVFDTTVGMVQLTLSLFLGGFAIAQLFVGPLSDRFGRRPVLLGGLLVFVIATVACYYSDSIEALIAARLFQAIGACAGAVLGRAIVRDVYDLDAARILAYMAMAMATAPMLAPIVGGYLELWYGWRSVFLALIVFGLVLLGLVALLLGETNRHKNPGATNLAQMVRNYRLLLGERTFVGYILTNAFIYSGLFCFISGSSFALIDFLGVRPETFGLYFATVVSGFIVGTFIAGRLTRRVGIDRLILTGCSVSLLFGALMWGLAAAGVDTVTAIVVPMTGFMVGVGLVMPNAMAGAIGPFPHMAGAASALMGFLQMGTAAAVSFSIGLLDDGTQIPMTLAIALMGILSIVSYLVLVRGANRP